MKKDASCGFTYCVVEVPASAQTPYYIKSEGLEKGVYVRVGATTRVASPEKVRELQLKGQNTTFDSVFERGAEPVSRRETGLVCQMIQEYLADVFRKMNIV